MPAALWIALIQTAGGWLVTLYNKAQMEQGNAIPPLADILKQIQDNQAEIDAGKIPTK